MKAEMMTSFLRTLSCREKSLLPRKVSIFISANNRGSCRSLPCRPCKSSLQDLKINLGSVLIRGAAGDHPNTSKYQPRIPDLWLSDQFRKPGAWRPGRYCLEWPLSVEAPAPALHLQPVRRSGAVCQRCASSVPCGPALSTAPTAGVQSSCRCCRR